MVKWRAIYAFFHLTSLFNIFKFIFFYSGNFKYCLSSWDESQKWRNVECRTKKKTQINLNSFKIYFLCVQEKQEKNNLYVCVSHFYYTRPETNCVRLIQFLSQRTFSFHRSEYPIWLSGQQVIFIFFFFLVINVHLWVIILVEIMHEIGPYLICFEWRWIQCVRFACLQSAVLRTVSFFGLFICDVFFSIQPRKIVLVTISNQHYTQWF